MKSWLFGIYVPCNVLKLTWWIADFWHRTYLTLIICRQSLYCMYWFYHSPFLAYCLVLEHNQPSQWESLLDAQSACTISSRRTWQWKSATTWVHISLVEIYRTVWLLNILKLWLKYQISNTEPNCFVGKGHQKEQFTSWIFSSTLIQWFTMSSEGWSMN